MFCSKCGVQISDIANFCFNCGSKKEDAGSQSVTVVQPSFRQDDIDTDASMLTSVNHDGSHAGDVNVTRDTMQISAELFALRMNLEPIYTSLLEIESEAYAEITRQCIPYDAKIAEAEKLSAKTFKKYQNTFSGRKSDALRKEWKRYDANIEAYKNEKDEKGRQLRQQIRDLKCPSVAKDYMKVVSQYAYLLHESDFGSLDYIIYLFVTNRSDSMKEALQLLDEEKRTQRIIKSIDQASSYIVANMSSIMNTLGDRITKAIKASGLMVASAISAGHAAQMHMQIQSSSLIAGAITNVALNQYLLR